ncbi:MAG TPA: hypothetical protein VLL97_13040 [Acidobacteriota bacterium]|nr:hypothetical protein [Acidobacteriota bacterium]
MSRAGQNWRDGHDAYREVENPVVRAITWDAIDKDGSRTLFIRELQPPSKGNQKLMPSSLRNKWREIGIHWAINHAMENGYARVAIASGTMAADTYKLSRKVESIDVATVTDPGTGEKSKSVGISLKGDRVPGIDLRVDGNGTIVGATQPGLTGKPLADVIGKGMADKIMSSNDGAKYSGEGLEIGGEGLKRLYDQDLPSVMKRFGAKPASMEISMGEEMGEVSEETLADATWAILDEGYNKSAVARVLEAARESENWGEQYPFKSSENRDAIEAYRRERMSRDVTATVTSIDVKKFRDDLIDSNWRAILREAYLQHPKQLSLALEDLKVDETVASVGGELSKAATDKNAPSPLGLAITPILEKGKWVPATGRRVRNVKDVVAIGRLYRNPSYETFHALYVKGGQVIAHEAVSARMPGFAVLFTDPFTLEGRGAIRRRTKELDPDAVYFIHNHPSGDVTTSVDDRDATARYGATLPQFKGHIIVNHETYSVIHPDGTYQEYLHLPNKASNRILEPSIPHKGLGWTIDRPEAVAMFGKWYVRPSSDNVTLAWLSTKGKVRAIEAIPLETFIDRDAFLKWQRARASIYGATSVVAYYNSKNVDKSLAVVRAMRGYTSEGSYRKGDILLDGVVEGFAAGARMGAAPRDANYFGPRLEVTENRAQLGPTPIAKEDQTQYGVDRGKTKSVSSLLGGYYGQVRTGRKVSEKVPGDHGGHPAADREGVRESPQEISARRANRAPGQTIVSIADANNWLEERGLKPQGNWSPTEAIETLQQHPDWTGLSDFDKARLQAQLERPEYESFWKASRLKDIQKMTTSKTQGKPSIQDWKNEKTKGSNILSGDTIKSCETHCIECYANNNAMRHAVRGDVPVKMDLPPGAIREEQKLRLGTMGDPGSDWKHTNEQIRKKIRESCAEGHNVSPEKNIFVVTPLLDLDGYDPKTVPNLQVSLDPVQFDKTRVSMLNILRVKARHPEVNIAVRIRSLATNSPDFNAARDALVGFANRFNLRGIETMLRFRKNVTKKTLQLIEDAYEWKKPHHHLKSPQLKGQLKRGEVCDEKGTGCPGCLACRRMMDNRDENIRAFSEAMEREGITTVSFRGLPRKLDIIGPSQMVQVREDQAEYGSGREAQNPDALMEPVAAYHGSPHRFDKFSTEKIGTGEGAQSYGHGLYFSDKKEVAEYYKNNLAGNAPVFLDGERVWRHDLVDAAREHGFTQRSTTIGFGLYDRLGRHGSIDAVRKELRELQDDPRLRRYADTIWETSKELELLDVLGDRVSTGEKPKGHLYEVELAPREDEYLLWDEPLTRQPLKVRDALSRVKGQNYESWRESLNRMTIDEMLKVANSIDGNNTITDYWDEDTTGQDKRDDLNSFFDYLYAEDPESINDYIGAAGFLPDQRGSGIYRQIAAFTRSDKAASEYLHSLGIRGIKYLDGSSRTGGGESHNYVIFSDSDVDITAVREKQAEYNVRRSQPKPLTQEEIDAQLQKRIRALEIKFRPDKKSWKGVIDGLYDENVPGAALNPINYIRSADLVLARNPLTALVEKEIKYASREKKIDMQHYNDIATGIVKDAGIKKGSEEDAMVKDLLDFAWTGLTPDELRRSAAYKGDKEAAIRAAERLRNEVFEPIIHRIRGDKELTNIIGQRGYIRGYFPHYWEQMKAKYGERDAALIVKHILPERFVSRFLKERESNAWLGNVSIFDVVPAYIQSTMRTIHDIPAYNRALQHLENVPDGSPIREFAGWYVDNYMGVNTRDYLGLIPRDHPIIKLSRWIANRHYDATIGLNIKTWSVNTLQTLSNTVPELGMKYTAIGIRELATREGRKKFHDAGLLFDYPGIESGILGEGTYRRIMHGGMALAEYVNRGIAYLGGLEQAHDLGLVGKAAEHHAMDVVEKTQFTYSKESAIRTLDSLTPDMKVLMTFPMKEAEFFAGLVKDAYHGGSHEKMKLVRFLLINFGLAAAAKAAGLQIRDWLIDLMDMIPGIPRSLQLIEKLRTWLWRISDGQVKPKDIPKDILEGLYKAFGPGAVALRRLARQTGIIEDNRRKKAS